MDPHELDRLLHDVAGTRAGEPVPAPDETVLDHLRARGRARRHRRGRRAVTAAATAAVLVACIALLAVARWPSDGLRSDRVDIFDEPLPDTSPTSPIAGPATSTSAPTTTTAGSSGTSASVVDGGDGGSTEGAGAGAGDDGSDGSGASDQDGRGCAATGGPVPAGAVTAPVVDVDGDGRGDQVWYSGPSPQRVGLRTASGAVTSSVVDTAKPVNAVLVVDADQRGPVEVLIDNGSGIDLWVVLDCRLVPVIGPDGAPYLFDTGYRGNGTGAICADVDGDGRRDLVGVNLETDEADGQDVSLARTVIDLDGATAAHGYHDRITVTIDADPATPNPYSGIRCGSLSLTTEMLMLVP